MAIYLEYDGIKGNCTADGYKDQITVLSCNFGISRGITMEAGNMSNREATRPSLSELSISKESDNSCINLFKEAVSGDAGKTVKVHFVRTGADKVIEFMTYELENCLVSSYTMSGQAEGLPMENITLSFSKMMVTYNNTDAKVAGGSQQRVGYDLEKAVKL